MERAAVAILETVYKANTDYDETVAWVKERAHTINAEEGRAFIRIELDAEEWAELMSDAQDAFVFEDLVDELDEAHNEGHAFALIKWET